jgi:protein phosphatase PTC7
MTDAGEVYLSMGVANRPHDDKLSDGGDDAWFLTNSVVNAVGVADGVGAWRSKGINAGECARELMSLCRDYYGDAYNFDNVPQNCLEQVIPRLRAEGSTTALVAKLSDDTDLPILEVAQIGDSDLVVYRQNYVVFQTLPQQHRHNQPFQVGPRETDTANDAQNYSVTVQISDYIVLGTDGLWDNLYASQVAQILADAPDGVSSNTLANLVASAAYVASQDPDIWSPFAQRAYEQGEIRRQNFEEHLGGKPDDITVVVCRVSN